MHWRGWVLGLLLFFTLLAPEVQAQDSIQKKINQARAGETIVINKDIHGSLVIDEPLILVGAHQSKIINKGDQPALVIQGSGVHVQGFTIINEGAEAAITVTGKGHTLAKLEIFTHQGGISIRDGHQIQVQQVKVSGTTKSQGNHSGNGIDLYQSSHNQISHNQITSMEDGVYLEESDNNQISQNEVTNSRYGIHLMFTHHNLLMDNLSHQNVSGAMIMSSIAETVKNNQFLENNEHVHSQGLFLFDVKDSTIRGNTIRLNRIGLILDDTHENQISMNQISNNFIGLMLKKSTNNHITGNDFKLNLAQAFTYDRMQNDIQKNYWDTATTIDADGDQWSDIAYPVDPVFLQIINENESYQLLFHTPGIQLIKAFLSNPVPVISDKNPAITAFHSQMPSSSKVEKELLFLSWSMLLLSIWMFQKGRIQS